MTDVQEIDILVNGLSLDLHDIFLNTLLNEVEILNNLSINTMENVINKIKFQGLKKGYKKVNEEDTKNECNICFEKFEMNQFKRTLECKHIFHKKCIDKWVNKYKKHSCPNCRDVLKFI